MLVVQQAEELHVFPMLGVPAHLKTVALCHPLTLTLFPACRPRCCTSAKSCSSKGFELVLSFVFLRLFPFFLFCSHLWTSWRAPELPICSPLLQPSAALQLGSSATCLSVEVPENNLEKDLFASAANFYFIRILSLLWISALTLVRHVFFSNEKI